MAFLEPVTLDGRHVRIEPLAHEHADGVRAAAADGELWRLWYTSVPAPDRTTEWIDIALDMRTRLGAMPFVVREKPVGDIVGATRYFNVDATNRRLEIGHTWYAKRVQRSAVNTECKLLLLEHAFETLGCMRVEFKTDARNARSRGALEALGCRFEGIHRKHMLVRGGDVRDSAYYSVLDVDWPVVRERLRARVEQAA